MKKIFKWIVQWLRKILKVEHKDYEIEIEMECDRRGNLKVNMESLLKSKEVKRQIKALREIRKNYKPPKCCCDCECGITKKSSKRRNRSDSKTSSSNCPSNHDL